MTRNKFSLLYPLTNRVLVFAATFAFLSPTFAQTVSRPGTLRADLSGVWQKNFAGNAELISEFPFTDWGREAFDSAKPLHGPRATSGLESNAPSLRCEPMGIPATYFRPRPFEIIQLADRLIMLLEIENLWRIIYTDGREFPEDPIPTWNGYAIGHYEGDALIIESRHFRGWESEDKPRWLDRLGHPFSDELILVERWRRLDQDTFQNEITIHDPVAYERPWTATMNFRLREGVELEEFICQEGDNQAFREFERQLLEYVPEPPE